MQEIVILKNNDCFTNSKVISEHTGNNHRSVQRIIEKHKKHFEKISRVRFEITPLKTKGGIQEVKIYFLDEQQATFLMTLLRNTEQVIEFKIRLVQEFYKMRQFILEKQSTHWIETRYQSKLTRKAETDIIKELVEYAKQQGSKNSNMLYMTYSKLANSMAGIDKRENATIRQLNNLTLIENIILNVIRTGISQNKHYKQIYQDSKKALETFNNVAYLQMA